MSSNTVVNIDDIVKAWRTAANDANTIRVIAANTKWSEYIAIAHIWQTAAAACIATASLYETYIPIYPTSNVTSRIISAIIAHVHDAAIEFSAAAQAAKKRIVEVDTYYCTSDAEWQATEPESDMDPDTNRFALAIRNAVCQRMAHTVPLAKDEANAARQAAFTALRIATTIADAL